VVRKGYKDDSDGDDSLSQRQQQLQAPHLSQEQQLLQATAMIHRALLLVSSVAGVPLPKLQLSQHGHIIRCGEGVGGCAQGARPTRRGKRVRLSPASRARHPPRIWGRRRPG
jgi:hypothetical protein